MAKLSWMKFFPADWFNDTMVLSAEARGCWINLICLMWNAPKKGEWTGTFEEFARVTGTPWENAQRLIQELSKVATVTNRNREVTLICRRIVKEDLSHKDNSKRQQSYRDKHIHNEKVTDKTLDVRLKTLDSKTTSLAVGTAKEYPLPDPKTDPKKCLVLSYKSRKGVPYDNRDWDIANFGRAMKASGVLLGICGDLAVAQTCLDALAADYDSKDLSWTIETVARNAADWLKKTGRLDANASRAGLRLAIAERRSKERREEGLVKASEGSVLTPLGDRPPSQSGT